MTYRKTDVTAKTEVVAIATNNSDPIVTPEPARKAIKPEKRALKPLPGKVFNPFFSHPRNAPCFCGSGIKFKKCHLDKLSFVIPAEKQETAQTYVNTLKKLHK